MRPRTHNLVSYGVALVLFLAVVFTRYRAGSEPLTPESPIPALLGVLMWSFHFARRTAESAWVHRYGKPRVPWGDIVVEYFYYWGFATWIALSLTSASYDHSLTWLTIVGALVFIVAESGNARAHRVLRSLRSEGSSARLIPRGFLFERVSSPHYLFEILSWLGFALVTQVWAAYAFLLVGAGILACWARARHAAYLESFDGREGREQYPAKRRALVPGLF